MTFLFEQFCWVLCFTVHKWTSWEWKGI